MLSLVSHVRLVVTLWTVAHQALLSVGLSRQDQWSGLPCLLQGIFLTWGLSLRLLCLLHWQAGSLPLVPAGRPMYISTSSLFNAGDGGLILGLEDLLPSPGEGNGNPVLCSSRGNSRDRRILAGYCLWGCKRVGRDLATKQQQQRPIAINVYWCIVSMYQCIDLWLPGVAGTTKGREGTFWGDGMSLSFLASTYKKVYFCQSSLGTLYCF